MPRTLYAHWSRGVLAACLLVAALLSAAPARAESDPIEIQLRLWTTPAQAARGDVVSYEILVDNNGKEGADRVRATLAFSTNMTVVRTEFDHEATWISELGADKLTVMFGRLKGGQDRRAKIFFQIGPNVPDGFQLRTRAVVRYERDGGSQINSNYTTLTVGGQEPSVTPEATVDQPVVPRKTTLTFSVRNYFPEEQLFTWINGPNGVIKSTANGKTDGSGAGRVKLNTDKLKPGSYSLVIHGYSSRIELVVPFTVQ